MGRQPLRGARADGRRLADHGSVAQSSRAITIQAPPAEVWPWLVQIGQDRGGFYTYEWIENALGARIRNADRIVPELQELAVGDLIRLTPDPYLGRIPGQSYEVREVRPQQALVLLQELPSGGATTWSFILRDADGGSTRLLVRARDSAPPHRRGRVARRVEQLLLGPGYLVMDRGMLRGIRRRAIARTSPQSGKGPGPGAAQLGRPLASAL